MKIFFNVINEYAHRRVTTNRKLTAIDGELSSRGMQDGN